MTSVINICSAWQKNPIFKLLAVPRQPNTIGNRFPCHWLTAWLLHIVGKHYHFVIVIVRQGREGLPVLKSNPSLLMMREWSLNIAQCWWMIQHPDSVFVEYPSFKCHHLHSFKIWSSGGATCLGSKIAEWVRETRTHRSDPRITWVR